MWCHQTGAMGFAREHFLELPDDATEEQIEETCQEAYEELAAQLTDGGWEEAAKGGAK